MRPSLPLAPMTFLSLFSGIGGMDLGLERAGMKCVGQVEIDSFCRRVLAKHWPDVPKWNDVREFKGEWLSEKPDLIAGGFPCQDISYAGNREGVDGERSGLWSEFHRVICELRPRVALVENVSALLDGGIGRVLGDLADCGYDAEWDCFTACSFGAPHARNRVFVVAYPDRSRRRIFQSSDGIHTIERPQLWERVGAVDKRTWLEADCGLHRNAQRIPRQMDRLRGIGNAVVPQVAEFIGRRILESEGSAVA